MKKNPLLFPILIEYFIGGETNRFQVFSLNSFVSPPKNISTYLLQNTQRHISKFKHLPVYLNSMRPKP